MVYVLQVTVNFFLIDTILFKTQIKVKTWSCYTYCIESLKNQFTENVRYTHNKNL